MILEAPTGWGKSLVICVVTLTKLLCNKRLRCIIAVPQTIIGRNFARRWRLPIRGQRPLWRVGTDLTAPNSPHTVRTLLNFLRAPVTRGKGDSAHINRVLICTHATLAQAYRRLRRTKRLNLLQNTLVWIDEGHHIMNAQIVNSQETVSNALGSLVKHCTSHNIQVGLATATYQRGDMRHILPDKLREEKFRTVEIPYDDYFAERAPVESFELKIVCGRTLDALQRIFKRHCPTILYLAKRQSRYAERCKYTEVKKICRQLSKSCRQPLRYEQDKATGAQLIRVGDLRILDLVHERGRNARKAYLDKGGHVDIILALDTCKEGFDWDKAERCIILGERHSMPEMIQMIGRLFRPRRGKQKAEVYQILPAAIPDSKQFKHQHNAILTVMFSAMLLEDVFVPIPVTGPKTPRRKRDRRPDRLVKFFSRTETWAEVWRDFVVAIHGRTYKAALRLGIEMLRKYNVPEDQLEATWTALWKRFAYTIRHQRGLKLNVPFEVLKNEDLSEGLLTWASGMCGFQTFAELRKVIGRTTRTLEEWVLIAEDLARKNYNSALENQTGVRPAIPCS
jgi:hypothetical protein